MDVETGHVKAGSEAILGRSWSLEAGVCWTSGVKEGNVKEGVEADHGAGHVVCPFEYLWANVDKEGVRRPAAEDHDLGCGVIHEEEGHGSTGADGVIAYFRGGESKLLFATEGLTGVTEQGKGEATGDLGGGDDGRCGDSADFGVRGCIGNKL